METKSFPACTRSYKRSKTDRTSCRESQMLGISEISRRLDLNKNMVYRILNTLQKRIGSIWTIKQVNIS